MNRRNFFATLAKATAGFAILPSAVTYARKWHKTTTGSLYVSMPVEGIYMEFRYLPIQNAMSAYGESWAKDIDDLIFKPILLKHTQTK